MGSKALFAAICWLAISKAFGDKSTVKSAVALDNESAESAPRLYRNVPMGIYASAVPYGSYSFHLPRFVAAPHTAASQVVPVKQEALGTSHAGFLKDSYGNRFVESPLTLGYKTAFPQEYLPLQKLPQHLAQPLVGASANFQFKQTAPQVFVGSPYRLPALQGPTPTPIHQFTGFSQPLIYADKVSSLAPNSVNFYGSPTAQQQPTNNKAVFTSAQPFGHYSGFKSEPKFQRIQDLPRIVYGEPKYPRIQEIHKEPTGENKFQRIKESPTVHQEEHQFGRYEDTPHHEENQQDVHNDNAPLQAVPAKKTVTYVSDVNGKTTIVKLKTDPPVPLLDLTLLEPLHFDNPLVPQVQHFLPRIPHATYQKLPQAKNFQKEFVVEKTMSYDSSGNLKGKGKDTPKKQKKPTYSKPKNNDAPKKTPVTHHETLDEAPEISYEINQPNYKETYKEKALSYNKETTSAPVSYSYGSKTDNEPVTYSYSRSSTEPQNEEIRFDHPQHLIYHLSPEEESDASEEEQNHPSEEESESQRHTSRESDDDDSPYHQHSEYKEQHNHKEIPKPSKQHQEIEHDEREHHQKQQENHQKQQEYHQKPQEYHQKPQEYHAKQQNYHDKQQDYLEKPLNYHDKQQDYHEKPQEYHQKPQEYHQEPHEYQPKQQNYRDKQQDYHEKPQEYHEKPQEYHQKPQEYHQKQQEYHDKPQEYHKKQQDYHDKPQEYHQKHQEYHHKPKEYHQNPHNQRQEQKTPRDVEVFNSEKNYPPPKQQSVKNYEQFSPITREYEEDIRLLPTPSAAIKIDPNQHAQHEKPKPTSQTHPTQSPRLEHHEEHSSAQHRSPHPSSAPQQHTHQHPHPHPSPVPTAFEHYSAPHSDHHNLPAHHIHEKSKHILIKDETPESMHMLSEKMREEMIKREENSEEDFDKAYEDAAIGFPAYSRASENVEKEVFNPASYGVPPEHIEYNIEHVPFQEYQADSDEYPKATRLSYKDARDKTKENYYADYKVSKPESLHDRYRNKEGYYKLFRDNKPDYLVDDAPRDKKKQSSKSAKYTAAPSHDYPSHQKAQSYYGSYKPQQQLYGYDYSKGSPRDSSAYASRPLQIYKIKTNFVEPQFQYGFEPISIPKLLDSELSAMASNLSPESEKPGMRKKIYKENWYIKQTSTSTGEPAS